MAKVEIRGLNKLFGDTVAVRNASLDVEDGVLLVLLGPSGSGKTTLLNCIAGLEAPTSGRILFDGEDVTDLPPHLRGIAMVFQASTLYPHLDARRNIETSLKTQELSPEEKQERIRDVTEMLGIDDLLDHMPNELSGGERQRVATAKAIVRDPELFLMDEPLSDLDADLRERLRAEITNLQKRLGTTMVFVTHDQTEAMTMGDKIAVMKDGEIQQIGSPDEIYNQPNSSFVARFVGSPPMNFFEGKLTAKNGRTHLSTDRFDLRLEGEFSIESGEQRDVVAGVRPHQLDVDTGDDGGANFQAEVFAVEPLGKETIVTLEFKQQKLKALAPADFRPRVGDRVSVTLRGENLHLFDRGTGERLNPTEGVGHSG